MKTCPKCGEQYQDSTTLCPADGTVLKKAGDDLIGQTLAGKYRIEERLDEGGMGTVYRATHILMEKTVAIKVLHPSLAADDKIVARFTREAKAASRISHPHALTVTDFGESENGIVFLVMEYLRGYTLKEVIRSEGRMALPRVVEIIRQVCGALEAAHAEGVVHRDLKSDNIMLEEVNGGGDWAKVLDFGIAKIQEPVGGTDPALTAPNLIIGTPQYMSPEQCSQASEIDSRSDIYSLGIILFELLVGHVPFTGDSPTAIMMKHLQEPAPSVLEERKDLPPSVGRVVSRALAKRQEDRYQTASELSEALTLAAVGESPATAAAIADAAIAAERAADDTNRIVVPTGSNPPARNTTNDDYDEATVVHSRAAAASSNLEVPSVLAIDAAAPPTADRFNPWRIAVPAVALLVIVFAVVYALQRNTGGASTEEQAQPLTIDPNGLPVQSTSPATGAAETSLTPGTLTPTAPTPGTIGDASGTASTGNRNSNSELPQATPGDASGNDNDNSNDDNSNADNEPEATPTPAKRNDNQRRSPPPLPSPEDSDDDDAPPTPKPKEKKTPPVLNPSPSDPLPVQADPPSTSNTGARADRGAHRNEMRISLDKV
ncbi:MAG TPA: serine/threonine-protein kinase [Pyrinomonadaceae bacterium]|jgi:serine/threonine-protein kinase